MSEIKSRADLLEAAAKMMRMCDDAGVDYAFRNKELLHNFFPAFSGEFQHYAFPLAIVEGKPVFKGDDAYVNGHKVTVVSKHELCDSLQWIDEIGTLVGMPLKEWSLLPPKPKTVMVELSVEDADRFFNSFDQYPDGLHGRIARACCKALEESR